jgi:midasin
MEALTLLTSALSRLEVGSLGVVAFGGHDGTRLLHELGQPWTDASAASALGALHFTADHTLHDTPLLDLLKTSRSLFASERQVARSRSGRSLPSQLLLIVADGHFHERGALQRAVREVSGDMADGEGPLVFFIILDAGQESILELQQVKFEGSTPVLKKYLDGFPFPYYMVLRDIEHLPHLLADLMRQWLQLYSM